MNPKKKRSTSLFLIELMIALLFFSLAATICIQFFVQAHLQNRQAADLSQAIAFSQNLAEEFRAHGGTVAQNSFFFDENWEATEEQHASFTLRLEEAATGLPLRAAHIKVYEIGEQPLFELEVMVVP